MDSDRQVVSPRAEVLQEAIACVTRDRNDAYGSPEDNFAAIAALWAVYDRYVPRGKYSPEHDVSMKMILLKIGRIMTGTPGVKDNYIDGPGYFATAWGSYWQSLSVDKPYDPVLPPELAPTERRMANVVRPG